MRFAKLKISLNVINILTNPYENKNFEKGLLLLNYPCCEAYTISLFEKNKFEIEKNIKKYVSANKFNK